MHDPYIRMRARQVNRPGKLEAENDSLKRAAAEQEIIINSWSFLALKNQEDLLLNQ